MSLKTTREPIAGEMPAWGVFVFESHHAAGFRMEVSRHEPLEVVYVLTGEGRIELGGRPVRIRSGDVVLVPSGCAHRILDDPEQPLSIYGVRIRPGLFASDPELAGRLAGGRQPLSDGLSRQVRAEVRRLLFEQSCRRPGRATMLTGLALQLLVMLARAQGMATEAQESGLTESSALLARVESYVHDLEHRFFEPADLDRVAEELSMSRRRFTDLFRQVTGSSWSAHLRGLRVAHACQLLKETRRTIPSIAWESGFEDLSSFYRAFQRVTGSSPQRWRTEHQ